jgi:hypothetical protein
MIFRLYRMCLILTLTCFCITSCDYYSGKKGGRSTNYGTLSDPNIQEGSRLYGSQQAGGILNHKNTTLQYSRDLSNKVAGLPGVRAAIVMLTDYNAYAAVLIDNSVHGVRGPDSKKETNHAGTSIGTYDPDTFNEAVKNWELASGTNNYETVEHQENINPAFKQKIAIAIRLANPKVIDVYISANRDYINQLNAYAIESWRGQPLDRHLNEFNATANRLFAIPESNMGK